MDQGIGFWTQCSYLLTTGIHVMSIQDGGHTNMKLSMLIKWVLVVMHNIWGGGRVSD